MFDFIIHILVLIVAFILSILYFRKSYSNFIVKYKEMKLEKIERKIPTKEKIERKIPTKEEIEEENKADYQSAIESYIIGNYLYCPNFLFLTRIDTTDIDFITIDHLTEDNLSNEQAKKFYIAGYNYIITIRGLISQYFYKKENFDRYLRILLSKID